MAANIPDNLARVRQTISQAERAAGRPEGSVQLIAAELGLFPRILLQANLAGEASKFGFSPAKLLEQVETIAGFKRANIEGLMTIPPLASSPEHSRPYFVALRELRDRFARESGFALPELSM